MVQFWVEDIQREQTEISAFKVHSFKGKGAILYENWGTEEDKSGIQISYRISSIFQLLVEAIHYH